jgi:hypothetical protein
VKLSEESQCRIRQRAFQELSMIIPANIYYSFILINQQLIVITVLELICQIHLRNKLKDACSFVSG